MPSEHQLETIRQIAKSESIPLDHITRNEMLQLAGSPDKYVQLNNKTQFNFANVFPAKGLPDLLQIFQTEAKPVSRPLPPLPPSTEPYLKRVIGRILPTPNAPEPRPAKTPVTVDQSEYHEALQVQIGKLKARQAGVPVYDANRQLGYNQRVIENLKKINNAMIKWAKEKNLPQRWGRPEAFTPGTKYNDYILDAAVLMESSVNLPDNERNSQLSAIRTLLLYKLSLDAQACKAIV